MPSMSTNAPQRRAAAGCRAAAWCLLALGAMAARAQDPFDDVGGALGPPVGYPVGALPYAAWIGQLDFDPAPELVVGNENSDELAILQGDGAGGFGTASFLAAGDGAQGVAAGDVDGDGDADLLVANLFANTVTLRRNGGGVFGGPETIVVGPNPHTVVLADLDGDGDLDLIGYLSLLRNDGTGHFVDDASAFAGSGFGGQVPRPYAVGDVDGDGDVDVVGSYDVFANLQRQLAVRRLPALGGPLEVDVFAARAAAPFAIVFLGTQATALPIPPWGILRVGLPGMLATQGVSIPAATGKATLTGTIPNSAALAGAELFLQPLVLDGTDLSRARFGNLVREVVVP